MAFTTLRGARRGRQGGRRRQGQQVPGTLEKQDGDARVADRALCDALEVRRDILEEEAQTIHDASALEPPARQHLNAHLMIANREAGARTLKVKICWTPSSHARQRSSATPTCFASLTSIVCSGQSTGSFTVSSSCCSSTEKLAVTSLTALATLIVMFSPECSVAALGSLTRASSVRMMAGEKCFDVYDATAVESWRSRQSASQVRIREGRRRRVR